MSTLTWERIRVVPDTMACRMTTPARAATSSGEADRLVRCRMSIASASVPVRLRPSSGSVPTLSRWMCGCTKALLTRRPPTSSSARHSPSTRSPTRAIRPEDMAIPANLSLFSSRQFRSTRSNGAPPMALAFTRSRPRRGKDMVCHARWVDPDPAARPFCPGARLCLLAGHAVLWPGAVSRIWMRAERQPSSACGQRGQNGQPPGASPTAGGWPGMAGSRGTGFSIEGSEAISADV